MRMTWLLVLPTIVAGLVRATPMGSSAPAVSPACDAAEFHQFDFFAGDWDTYDVSAPAKLVARNHVTPMVGGCALREVYQQNDGMEGESFSTYDRTRHQWHQSWVTNRGELLLLDGGLDGDRMVLTATIPAGSGASTLLRAAWWREGSTVREKAESSADGGTSWTGVFDIVFRPHGT